MSTTPSKRQPFLNDWSLFIQDYSDNWALGDFICLSDLTQDGRQGVKIPCSLLRLWCGNLENGSHCRTQMVLAQNRAILFTTDVK